MSTKPSDEVDSQELQIAGSWLEALSDGSNEVTALFDENAKLVYLYTGAVVEELMGYTALELMAMSPTELLHPQDVERVVAALHEVISHPGSRMTIDYLARHSEGHFLQLQSTAVNRLRQQHVGAVVVHTRQVREAEFVLRTPESQLPTPAILDASAFALATTEALDRARAEDFDFSVLLVNVDKTKFAFNTLAESLRHKLFERIARRLVGLLRPDDLLARLADTRFAILVSGVAERRQAERVAQRVHQALSRAFEFDDKIIKIATSIGIATSDRIYQRAGDVLRDAELATSQQRAQVAEKRAAFRAQMQMEKSRQMQLVAELEQGLEEGQFRLHYQPIIALANRSLSGFEALVRWQHPQRGLLVPAEFLPYAEQTGLIRKLGRWTLQQACQQMAAWRTQFDVEPTLYVSVNLSPKQLGEQELCDYVLQLLKDDGLQPDNLAVEVTEAGIVENRTTAAQILNRLREAGIKICMDNFGAGASSFGQLQQIPYDTLSIDRSLVAAMSESSRNRELVRALVGFAHNLAMNVLAEGVETPNQAAQLGDMLCEYAQGYLFAKPLPSDEASELIASHPQWWSHRATE